jgi:hypothetical protein
MAYRIKSPDGRIFETKRQAMAACDVNASVIDYLIKTPNTGWTRLEKPRVERPLWASEFHDRPGGPVASQVYNLKIEVQSLQNQLQAYQAQNTELLRAILTHLTQPSKAAE